MQQRDAVPQRLAAFFGQNPRVALAFSGGVDSAYLLYAAKACGAEVTAYYVNTQFQPAFELADAGRLAGQLGAVLRVLDMDILANPAVTENPPDRCYHCKRAIFGAIMAAAAQDGYTVLLDGSNASDDAADRPGMRALAELRVLSPLRQAGLTKKQVRLYSRRAGLFTWNKPAYACLATRLPTGTPLQAAVLQKVERAEEALKAMGFFDLRVRVQGGCARLQLPAAQLEKAARLHGRITAALAADFDEVLLDLKPR